MVFQKEAVSEFSSGSTRPSGSGSTQPSGAGSTQSSCAGSTQPSHAGSMATLSAGAGSSTPDTVDVESYFSKKSNAKKRKMRVIITFSYVFPILIICSCCSTNFGRLPRKLELWEFRQ